MDYVELLRKRADEVGNIACVGLDPVIERIPVSAGSIEGRITAFYQSILDEMVRQGVMPAIVKPNAAFYEQYGLSGLRALKNIIDAYKEAGIPVILDGKRGDIGDTSTAYAKGWFGEWGADAMTVAPYMGSDSVQPFIEHCKDGKGVYVLVRTSNKGAKDFQGLVVDGRPLYRHVAEKLVSWRHPGLGAVVGATSCSELEELSSYFVSSGKEIPLLIPGVGKQGGSATEVMDILRRTGNDPRIHRINSSSAINFACEKEGTADYAGAAVRALKKLIDEIGPIR
jgi:orotidine-5'-phosphate decarboxylase